MNVLLVDDHPNFIKTTAVAFRLLGCETFLAHSIADATRLLDTEAIDALFLDVNLSGESGLEFLSDLARQPARPPIVMLTALTRDEIGDEAVRRGAFGCLTKPFTLDELRQQMADIEQFHRKRKSSS